MELLIGFAIVGLIPAIIASHKGRSFILWWIYGTFLFLIALVHAAVIKPRSTEDQTNTRVCPFCAETVKQNASICKHCHKELPFTQHEQTQPKPNSSKVSLVLAIVLVVTVLITVDAINSKKAKNNVSDETAAQTEQEVKTIRGGILDYQYDILYKDDESRYVSTFNPFLPRDDEILTTVMTELINKTYSENIAQRKPELYTNKGINVIRIKAKTGYYYFNPIKEDTGEIHSIVFWNE